MIYKGSCHCKSVKFSIETSLDKVVQCNCSFCKRRNAKMIIEKKEAIEITQGHEYLKLYQFNAITAGTDAQGEVTVRLEDEDLSSQAKGSDPDIIVASAKAYINALNRLIFKKSKSIKENSSNLKIEGV